MSKKEHNQWQSLYFSKPWIKNESIPIGMLGMLGKAQQNEYYEYLWHKNIDIDIYVHNNKI